MTTITETDQYTGTVSWEPDDDPFDYSTEYTATITLTAKSGYTLTGVDADFFIVAEADSVSNDADSGVVTAIFPETEEAVYEIGDPGPAGGIIFYIDEAEEHDWTYLEAAPQSTEWEEKEWGTWNIWVGGTETAIGTGENNTALIVPLLNADPTESDRAAQLFDALEHEHGETTYRDWFLPSKDELNAIWENIAVMVKEIIAVMAGLLMRNIGVLRRPMLPPRVSRTF